MAGVRIHPIYKGIDRPALWQGLPTMYLMIILGVAATVTTFAPMYVGLGTGVILFFLLKWLYTWEPQFLQVLQVSLVRTPLTRNRKRHGGHYYAP